MRVKALGPRGEDRRQLMAQAHGGSEWPDGSRADVDLLQGRL